ncbi:hypothetical protein ACMD2_25468, partial [Ananas comosus]
MAKEHNPSPKTLHLESKRKRIAWIISVAVSAPSSTFLELGKANHILSHNNNFAAVTPIPM